MAACGADRDLLAEIVREFLDDAAEQLAAAQAAIAASDHSTVGKIAHRLRGASLTIGGRPFAVVCEELEAWAAQGGKAAPDPIMARAVREYEKLRDAIQGDSQSEAA